MIVDVVLSIGFGIVFLSTVFLAVTWGRVVFDGRYNSDRKYLTIATGLFIANIGVGIMALNRTSISLMGQELYPVLLLIAAVVAVIGMITLMCGLSMGGKRRTFLAFSLLSIIWAIFCIWWFDK